jgi:ATP-dependent RNA helicase DDX21
MLNMGFQEDIEKIYAFIHEVRKKEEVQNLLYSATIPTWVHQVAKKFLSEKHKFIDLLKGVKLKTPDSVKHLAINCPFFTRMDLIGEVIMCYGGMLKRSIIFCDTKKDANNILLNGNIKASC